MAVSATNAQIKMENNSKLEEKSIESKKPSLNIASAIVISGLIIAGAIFVNHGRAVDPSSVDKLDLVSEVSSDDFVRGNKDAPITLIEYADFSCHFCSQYHPTLKRLITDEDDKVRWVYRHLPIFNTEAAIASECVGKLLGNEAFWNFSDTLFNNQSKFNSDYYLNVAISEGINANDFNQCIVDPVLKNKIQTDFTQERILLGFDATPYTVIVDKDGRKFSFAGALSYDELKSTIDGLDK
jgi:protein-disulfide isomerase